MVLICEKKCYKYLLLMEKCYTKFKILSTTGRSFQKRFPSINFGKMPRSLQGDIFGWTCICVHRTIRVPHIIYVLRSDQSRKIEGTYITGDIFFFFLCVSLPIVVPGHMQCTEDVLGQCQSNYRCLWGHVSYRGHLQ